MEVIILLLLVPQLVCSHKINIQGNVEMGNQMKYLFKRIFETSGKTFGDMKPIEKFIETLDQQHDDVRQARDGDDENKELRASHVEQKNFPDGEDDIPFLDKVQQTNSPLEDMKGKLSVLDEVIHKNTDIHVYGKHLRGSMDKTENNIKVWYLYDGTLGRDADTLLKDWSGHWLHVPPPTNLVSPLVWSYSLKVNGKVDLGDQIGELFKELKTRVLEHANGNDGETMDTFLDKAETLVMNHGARHISKEQDETSSIKKKKQKRRGKPKRKENVSFEKYKKPVLDMAIEKKKNVHLYGRHHKGAMRTRQTPLNNVQA